MLVVLRFAVERGSEDEFLRAAHEALEVLAARPGYRDGQLGRAYDDPTVWALVTRWESVGAYRRALSSYEVKMHATPLLGRATAEPSAFEPLAAAEPGGRVWTTDSDLASAADPDGAGGIRSRP